MPIYTVSSNTIFTGSSPFYSSITRVSSNSFTGATSTSPITATIPAMASVGDLMVVLLSFPWNSNSIAPVASLASTTTALTCPAWVMQSTNSSPVQWFPGGALFWGQIVDNAGGSSVITIPAPIVVTHPQYFLTVNQYTVGGGSDTLWRMNAANAALLVATNASKQQPLYTMPLNTALAGSTLLAVDMLTSGCTEYNDGTSNLVLMNNQAIAMTNGFAGSINRNGSSDIINTGPAILLHADNLALTSTVTPTTTVLETSSQGLQYASNAFAATFGAYSNSHNGNSFAGIIDLNAVPSGKVWVVSQIAFELLNSPATTSTATIQYNSRTVYGNVPVNGGSVQGPPYLTIHAGDTLQATIASPSQGSTVVCNVYYNEYVAGQAVAGVNTF